MEGAVAVVAASTLVVAMAPPTDGDALCYHLQVPKVFLMEGSVGYDPDLHETVYPMLVEMMYAAGLSLSGPVACRLIEWVLGICFAAGVAVVARPWMGEKAPWAGGIALLVPAVSNGMSAPLNDVALAAYGMATLVAWMEWKREPSWRRAAVAGVFAGLAVGVKFPALVWVGLLGLGMAAVVGARLCRGNGGRLGQKGTGTAPASLRERSRDDSSPDGIVAGGADLLSLRDRDNKLSRPPTGESGGGKGGGPVRCVMWAGGIRQILVFGAVAVAVGGAWYGRAYVHTGNPVHPFFKQTFGGAGLDEVLDPVKRPMEVTPWNLVGAIGPMTLEPDRFDSFSHQFGPVFLMFLPVLLVARPPKGLAAVVALGYAFLMICLTQRQSMRFVLIAVGPMAVGAAWVMARWAGSGSRAARLLIVGAALVVVFEAGLAVARVRRVAAVVAGLESRDDYLARTEPTYRVGKWIGENLDPGARVIGQDHRGFYIPRPYTMELAHRRRTGLAAQGERMVEELRARGFTHLMMCPPVPENAVEFDPTMGRLLGSWLEGKTALYREDITDPDGVTRRYAIYDLGAGAPAGLARRGTK